jgi:transcription initiation factor TFIID TATA-box-binding protein
MPTVKPRIKIENVVASAALKHGIDLGAVVQAFPDVEYHPKEFPGLVFRLKKPKTATLIFASGKMVCTGARSEGEARRALVNVVRKLKKSGIIIVGKQEIKIQNVVASANLSGWVDLMGLYEIERSMRGRILYEPEQFPGLIYRMNEPKVVLLLFASGKLVCTGARKEEDVFEAVGKIQKRLEEQGQIHYTE